jgi:hypothetical protein
MIKKIIVLATLFVSISSFSQKNNISPYSFFGIGQINEAKTVTEHSMGVSTALNSSYKLYFSNPASLASLRFTTYSLGVANIFTKIDNGNETQSASDFSLSYLALGFPVGKKAGVAFGIQPFSSVGYNITTKAPNVNIDNEIYTSIYEGYGRTNRVFLGFGQKLPYNINIGAEASYTFGSLERTILSRNEEQLDRLATYYKTDTKVGGYAFKFGAQHHYKLNKQLDIKSGVSLLLENKLDYDGTENLSSVLNSSNPAIIIPRDEIYDREFIGNITMPLKTSLSVGVGSANKWFAGVEYDFQDATSFSTNFSQNNNNISYIKATNLAFGGFYTPKAESITKYWERITYNAGIHIKQTGLEINNTAIKDFGISFGVSLPSKRQLSNINLGFDIGKRGEINNNGLIKENYYNFRLSLSLNDKWFIKRKLD